MVKPVSWIKNGRIYWIKPFAIPGMKSKKRPALAVSKYGSGKTIFVQIGTKNSKISSSEEATILFKKCINISKTDLVNSNLHLDVSKPEWNTSVLKPYLKNGKYVDCSHKIFEQIKTIYYYRKEELEQIRIRKAKIYTLMNNEFQAKKQLKLLKMQDPIKHKNMKIDKLYNKFLKL